MTNQICLFDTHCHLDFPQFRKHLDKMLNKAEDTGICGILIPGVKQKGWRLIRQISATHSFCYTALGLHPLFVEAHDKSDLHSLELELSAGPIAAIGEIGLDYYNEGSNRHLQVEYFKSQIAIAKSADLPLVLHVRKAHDEVLKIITDLKHSCGGIVHAFNGSEHQANRYIERGFKLGFGGAMTYPRAAKLHRLAQNLPIESIVIETDAPDMPPSTCKTGVNTPLHLFDNFRSLVALREESAAQIAKQTTINAHQVLRLD